MSSNTTLKILFSCILISITVCRTAWFVAIMALGNTAMACYVLVQLAQLSKDKPASAILAARNG
jgi:hypothetical protein